MEDIARLARTEVSLRALADAVNDRLKTVRAEMQTHFDNGHGLRQVAATLPDGTEVAKVTVTDPKPEAQITDPDAFRDWVLKHRPSEIRRTVLTEVRDAYKAVILNECTAAGVAKVCDRETGEVFDVPGVTVRPTRARGHSVRFAKTGKEQIAEAWRNGLLVAEVLPQLTAGGGEPDDAA
ncbi:MAG: hypothetical protein HOV68_17725 [Streptomycetaceae bacterium]|nr:hypothetical protein [Streptomycetaceae bacterium]